jgi:nitrogen fixation/metabolism regulation signal transduction histidine kinase
MAIDGADTSAFVAALCAEDWATVLRGVDESELWLRAAIPGDAKIDPVIRTLVRVADHNKWEVRRAIANLAGRVQHPAFEPILARFRADDNALVREAARRAALRRRDWQNAGAFGRQHEQRINATLDDIEGRFGVRGRDAVKRASEQVADTFARELYHEIVKLVAPIANSAERLNARLSDDAVSRSDLAKDAATIGRRVVHLKAVLDAMRAYTAVPALDYAMENLAEVVSEALALVREGSPHAPLPAGPVQGPLSSVEICRPRFVQAVTNLLMNAIESYEGLANRQSISVTLEEGDGWSAVIVADLGCGMSKEDLVDATVLFTTSKQSGTGFGLPLAKRIIESEHGGRLTIESDKGRGTSVRVAVPTSRQVGSQ